MTSELLSDSENKGNSCSPSSLSQSKEKTVAEGCRDGCQQGGSFPSVTSSSTGSFMVGEIVDVQSRTWPGINKPGGTAKIKSFDAATGCYNVSYVLGGKEDGVEEKFISARNTEMAARQRRPTSVVNIAAPDVVKKKKLKSNSDKSINKPLKKAKKKYAQTKKKSDIMTQPTTAVETCAEDMEEDYESFEEEENNESESGSEIGSEKSDYLPSQSIESQLSGGTKAAMVLMHQAFQECQVTSDGGFSAVDIRQFILSHDGQCSEEDVEEAYILAEAENKIMVVSNDDADGLSTRSIYVI